MNLEPQQDWKNQWSNEGVTSQGQQKFMIEINDFSQGPQAFMASVNEHSKSVITWYANYGASQHMSNQRSWFCNFTPIMNGIWHMQTIASHFKWVKGIGDIKIQIFINN